MIDLRSLWDYVGRHAADVIYPLSSVTVRWTVADGRGLFPRSKLGEKIRQAHLLCRSLWSISACGVRDGATPETDSKQTFCSGILYQN